MFQILMVLAFIYFFQSNVVNNSYIESKLVYKKYLILKKKYIGDIFLLYMVDYNTIDNN